MPVFMEGQKGKNLIFPPETAIIRRSNISERSPVTLTVDPSIHYYAVGGTSNRYTGDIYAIYNGVVTQLAQNAASAHVNITINSQGTRITCEVDMSGGSSSTLYGWVTVIPIDIN